MGSDSEKECCDAMKYRNIPKLTQTDKSDNGVVNKTSGLKRRTNNNEPNGKKETSEERVDRISHTSVSFMEFWFQCLDWEMLRLFFGLLMLFFCMVGVASIFYLFAVFSFNEKLWYYYFPVSTREELWLFNKSQIKMNTSTETAAIFSRKSKIIWKPSLQLNIGLADLNNYTMEHSSQNSYDFERIELQQYILHGFVLLLVLFGLLFLYICFWKWVAHVVFYIHNISMTSYI